MGRPKVTIGAVTNRPQCREWLTWNVRRQTYRGPIDLVLMDGGREHNPDLGLGPLEDFEWAKGRRWRHYMPGTGLTCGQLRNLVLTFARGDLLVWFDDDDWQHPERVAWLVEAIAATDEPWAGWSTGWVLRLPQRKAAKLRPGRRVINGGAIYRMEAARAVPYDSMPAASDLRWLQRMAKHHGTQGHLLTDDRVHAIWTQHEGNTGAHVVLDGHDRFSVGDLEMKVGSAAWGNTSVQLEVLERALASC